MHKSRIGRNKLLSVQNFATKRLMRDLAQIKKEPLAGISALPLENNLFVWHCNILGPKDTPWEGGIFHLVMHFDQDYPNNPPSLTLSTRVEHPNVTGNTVCLDMLEKRDFTTEVNKYEGWSAGYTVQSILVQLQSFLFEAEPSKILRDISNPKDYEKQKKEWLSGVRWSVEQSRNYTDKSVGHFPPRAPWPPLPEEKDTRLSLTGEQLLKDELTCFYTRQSFEEDCLGFGISYSKNLRTGEIKSIQSPLDLISLRAYMNHKLRLSAHNEKFTHWLPVFIDPKHGEKALYLAKRSMSIICTGHHGGFEPKHVLEILPKLMSTMLVEVMSGKRHASLKALRGYCFFHRMFLEFVNQYPALKNTCNEIVKNFIEDDAKRHKETGVPNLGEFLAILTVTDYTWADIREAYIQESFTRNVFWLLNRYPELEQESSEEFNDEDRIKYSFEVAKTSQKLLLFHVFFLNNIGKPVDKFVSEVIKAYDNNFGRPSAQLEDMFISACETINAVKDYDEFFKAIGKPSVDQAQLLQLLRDSIQSSREKGYHGSKASVLSPEQFAKENRPVDLEKLCTKDDKGELVLEVDEQKWKEMCANRWGLQDLPDYLENADNAWRKLYLQNNLQDIVTNFNDVPDFLLFHKTVDLSAEIPRLEITMFQPTNIKSKYFFLTALLTKLKNLDTLIIKKGETGLGTNGFKALVKGLANNPGTLETLILEFCDINSRSIEELTKGKLVSGNLRKLILKGNPLSDAGATHLATFLRQHQNLPHLTELDLSDCKIGYSGANAIAEALLVKKELKVLNMVNNQCSTGIQTIFQNLSYSPSIQEINVSKVGGSFNDSGTNSLKKLLQLSVTLSKLNLWKMTGVSSVSNNVFVELEKNTSVKELDLGDTGYNNLAELGKALSKNKTLQVLNLRNNSINCSHTFAMLEELKKGELSIKELNLANNAFHSYNKPKHRNTIGELLQLGKFITYVDLTSSNIAKEHMEAIGEALKPQNDLQLKTLILRKNNIGKYGLKPIVEALKVNTVLEELDLSGNDIGVLGSQSVSAFLKQNKSIKKLNLFGNLIEIEGALNIAEALKSNTTITDIDLGLNRIRARGALAVADLLATNETIQRIGLKHNHINDKSGMRIATSVVENKKSAINYIALAGNFLSVPCRGEIAVLFNQQGSKIVFDLAKLVEVKDAERQERTVYLSPLPMSVTEQQIKKIFYQNKCGVCLNVSIHTHKTRTTFAKGKYAFVEFAHVDSVALAMRLVHSKKNVVGGTEVRIVRAGVQQNAEEATKKTSSRDETASRSSHSSGRGGRGGFRRGRGRR